jgi:ABC-2 type transport system permease protein
VLLALIASMMIVTTVSIVIASYDFSAQLADYARYKAAAQGAGVGRIAPPTLFPLQLLRASVEYIQIIGAVIAIALGYLGVARERTGRTLPLILTRPVRTRDMFFGRLLGATGLLATILVVTAALSVVLVGLVGGKWLSGGELLRLAITFTVSLLYMLMFYALGTWISARSRVLANGLIVSLVIWLGVVLIIPQIGDTMDPDNQVPGGLFAALQVQKPDEVKILAHFSGYEKLRNGLEETSLTKHYERFVFAFTGIKEKYNGKPLSFLVNEKRNDIAWLAGYLALMGAAMWSALRRERITQRSEQ